MQDGLSQIAMFTEHRKQYSIITRRAFPTWSLQADEP